MPLLSVAIPTYQNPAGLKATLENLIAAATENNFLEEVEFSVADNSEDAETEQLVRLIASNSPASIKYHRHGENLGYDRNVDFVIKSAEGKYCWLLSDNERLLPNAFRDMFNEVKEATAGLIIICPDNVPVDRLKTYPDWQTAVAENDWWIPGGLVSRNIIKRALIPADLSSFYGNYWLHLSVTTMVAAAAPVRFIGEKFIDDKQGTVRWAKNGTAFITFTSLINIIEKLPSPPYARAFINTLTGQMRRGLPHNILSAKLYGLKVTRANLARLYQTTRKHPLILCVSFLAMLVPLVIVRYAKRFK